MKWKKAAAWSLTAAMVMNCIPGFAVRAAEINEGAEIRQEESEKPEEKEGNHRGEDETEMLSEDEKEQDGQGADGEESGQADIAPDMPELNFLYLEPRLEGEKQMVIASVELEGRQLTEAALTYRTEGGEEKLLEADELLEGYAVFWMEEDSIGEQGLLGLNMKVDGDTYRMDLGDFREEADTEKVEVDPEVLAAEQIPDKASRSLPPLSEEAEEEVIASGSEGISNALDSASGQAEKMSRSGTARDSSGTKDVVVVLDPGHGGGDGGATRTWNGVQYMEKEITLKISKYTKAELETYEGIRVYLTRDSDVAVGLENRVKMAADLGASAVISQHINSTTKNQDTASGSLVFVASGNYRKEIAQEGWDLASIILEELGKLGLKNNGTFKNLSESGNKYPNGKLADYYAIVRYGILYKVPGIIVEHAFVNNPSDCKKFFKNESNIRSLGVADATAIARYYGLKKKDGSTAVPPVEPSASGWNQENGNWYYLRADGARMKGFNIIDGDVYYFDSRGYRVTGWQDLEISRYYFKSDGVMSKYLTRVGKKYYYFNGKGWLKTGLIAGKGGKRYYAGKKGVLQTGWIQYKNKWYYFDPAAYAAVTGMQKIEGKWYYFGPKGVMKTGWQLVGKDYYYFNTDGSRKNGWIRSGSKWYFLNKKSGKMVKSKWVKSKKKYYYLNKKGVMLSNTTQKIKGKKYNFSLSGACANK